MTAAGPRRAVEGYEIARKLVHSASSITAAAIVLRAPRGIAITILLAALILALSIEGIRRLNPRVGGAFNRTFGGMLRPHERTRITGATTLATGFLAAAILTPPLFAAIGILMAGLGDAAGALVGRHFGKHRLPGGKSIEGSIACFVTAYIVATVIPGPTTVAALGAALVTTLAEAVRLPIDDNLFLPVASSFALWTLTSLP